MTTSIPVIDLAPLEEGVPGRDRVVDAFVRAYSDVGFAYLIGHRVAPALIDAVFGASKAFHALPLDSKMVIRLDGRHRGYIPISTSTDRTSTLATVTKPNQSASFMMMREDPADSAEVASGTYLAGPNRWPDLPGFREPVEAYYDAMCRLGFRLLDVVSSALGDDAGVLSSAFATPTTWLRLLHYPPVPVGAAGDLWGSAPHRDFGCITILAQDDVGGLQVRTPKGGWIDVPPRSDAFVMNVGDMLHRWSNGRLLSTPHRVVNRTGRERYSVPFFFDPHMSTTIEPLPGCVDASGPARFHPIEFGAFVRGELEASYDRHQPGQQQQ